MPPMCISTGEATFSGTIVYCGRQHHPVHGLIHVMGYQNTAVNLSDGRNAMLLHLPAQQLPPGTSSLPDAPATFCAAWSPPSNPSRQKSTA